MRYRIPEKVLIILIIIAIIISILSVFLINKGVNIANINDDKQSVGLYVAEQTGGTVTLEVINKEGENEKKG